MTLQNRDAARRWRTTHPARSLAASRKWQAANPEKVMAARKAYHLRRRYERYGISAEVAQTRMAAQGWRCALCKAALWSQSAAFVPHVDHDHETGTVRGLLCKQCNVGLGAFRDDPRVLSAAGEYLMNALKAKEVR